MKTKNKKILIGVGAAVAVYILLKYRSTSANTNAAVSAMTALSPSLSTLSYNPPNYNFNFPSFFQASSGSAASSAPLDSLTSPSLIATINW